MGLFGWPFRRLDKPEPTERIKHEMRMEVGDLCPKCLMDGRITLAPQIAHYPIAKTHGGCIVVALCSSCHNEFFEPLRWSVDMDLLWALDSWWCDTGANGYFDRSVRPLLRQRYPSAERFATAHLVRPDWTSIDVVAHFADFAAALAHDCHHMMAAVASKRSEYWAGRARRHACDHEAQSLRESLRTHVLRARAFTQLGDIKAGYGAAQQCLSILSGDGSLLSLDAEMASLLQTLRELGQSDTCRRLVSCLDWPRIRRQLTPESSAITAHHDDIDSMRKQNRWAEVIASRSRDAVTYGAEFPLLAARRVANVANFVSLSDSLGGLELHDQALNMLPASGCRDLRWQLRLWRGMTAARSHRLGLGQRDFGRVYSDIQELASEVLALAPDDWLKRWAADNILRAADGRQRRARPRCAWPSDLIRLNYAGEWAFDATT